MKKIILLSMLILSSLYAQDVVHYDTKDVKKPAISEPNHPSNELYKDR